MDPIYEAYLNEAIRKATVRDLIKAFDKGKSEFVKRMKKLKSGGHSEWWDIAQDVIFDFLPTGPGFEVPEGDLVEWLSERDMDKIRDHVIGVMEKNGFEVE
jgi:hypothetical protein